MIFRVNDKIIIDHKCRGFCKLPYPGHKDGCPNFGKHSECPPIVKFVEEVFDFKKDLFFVIEEFDLKSHTNNMQQKHPKWTNAQLKNLLYWQGGVRKKLKMQAEEFIQDRSNGAMIYTLLPEAMGVMVIDTTLALGIPIERQPINKVFKVALVGYSKHYESPSLFDF